ncbi:Nsp1-like C-terminal region-domain-containing protein [Russula brevipes]|nr:Nsp1-like C-terminal region-domain-containing protein [Russula brevipes]
MSNIFGPPSSQNKNQSTLASGSTPAAGTGLFGNLGANTTNSSAFGGTGAGNPPGAGGTTSGPTGSTLMAGGSAFGGGGSTNTTAPTLAGGSAFGAPASPATTTAPAGAATGSGLFPNASLNTNTGTSGTTAGQGLFGNTTGSTAGAAGAPAFGFPKPAGQGLFGSGSGGSTGLSGGGLFGGGGGGMPGATPAPTGTSTSSNTLGGGLFGNAKPADNAAKPATSSSLLRQPLSRLQAQPQQAVALVFFWVRAQDQRHLRILGSAIHYPARCAQPLPAFNLGAAAATGDKTASTTGTTAGGGLFSNLGTAANKDGKPEERKDGASTAPPPFSLGGQSTGAATTSAAPTTEKRDGVVAPSLFSGLGGAASVAAKPTTPLAGSTSTAPTAGTLALATSAISVPPPSMLKGKSIEEIINRWSTELESHVRDFNKFASEVAVWDRSLIENGNNLAALYSHVLAAEREQNDIDQSLDHIEQQEKELTATVEMYEKQMADILGGQGGTLRTLDTGPADTERDKKRLHNHLDDLSSSLTQLIESVNSMSVGQGDNSKVVSADDPMAQIAQVLSNHLESLQWIDGASRELEEKVVEVEQRIKDVGGVSQGALTLAGGSRSRGFGLNR